MNVPNTVREWYATLSQENQDLIYSFLRECPTKNNSYHELLNFSLEELKSTLIEIGKKLQEMQKLLDSKPPPFAT